MKVIKLLLLTLLAMLAGCGSSVNVTVGQLSPFKQVRTAALVPQEGNTPEIDAVVQKQLMAHSIAPQPPLPPGTRQSGDVDLIVTYSMEKPQEGSSVTLSLLEAPTGNLLVAARWEASRFQDRPKGSEVVEGLLNEVLAELGQR